MNEAERATVVPEGVGVVTEGVGAAPASDRIAGFDLARALAFLGMVFVNYRVAIAAEGTARVGWPGSPRGSTDAHRRPL